MKTLQWLFITETILKEYKRHVKNCEFLLVFKQLELVLTVKIFLYVEIGNLFIWVV